MGQSMTSIKNESLINMLLSKLPAGKKATIGNIAKSTTLSLKDIYSTTTSSSGGMQSFTYTQTSAQAGAYFSTTSHGGQNSPTSAETFKQLMEASQGSTTTANGTATTTNTNAQASVSVNGTGAGASGGTGDARLDENLRQAQEAARQLNLGDDTWGLESLARDLAKFDLDFTALKGDPHALIEQVREKSKAMVETVESRRYEKDYDYVKELNSVTGASARLVNALNGVSSAVARASVSVETGGGSGGSVSIGGTQIDATAVISAANSIVDPLVFDMNGDGFSFKGAEDGVDFDMDGTGEQSRMGFIKGDDALLFLDSNGDGVVSDGRQLFGNQDGYANGFEKLRELDENGDGVIDENDSAYDQLRLWVEKNEDGVCEEGETVSLRDAGITSIDLGYKDVREDDGNGNLVSQVGAFTRADGSKGTAADVWFQALARMP